MAASSRSSSPTSGSGRTKREGKEKHKKKRKKKKKTITQSTILGSLPVWILVVLLGGIALFFSLNGYLAMSLIDKSNNSDINDSMPFFRQMWTKGKGRLEQLSIKDKNLFENVTNSGRQQMIGRDCASFGCAITPPDYKGDQIQQALLQIKNDTSDMRSIIAPFASWEMATMTRKSNRKHPPFNQDAAAIIKPFQTAQTTSKATGFFVGIFDGHGEDGHIDAQYFVKDVPKRLAQKLDSMAVNSNNKQATIVQHLKDTFVESDELAPKKMKLRGGCTASVTLRVDNTLYFANAGDSRTMLVAVNAREFQIVEAGPAPGVSQLYITRADKPHLPDELARIKAAGGTVHIPPPNPNLSRVIVHSDEFNDTIGLAMSRSLGDYEWTLKGVTPEPLVDVISLDDFHNSTQDPMTSIFLVAASDGLWDYRLKQWYAKQFAESFLNGKDDKRRIHPLQKMQDIIEFVSPNREDWYRDDITVVTLRIM